jgi:hypothetical protein
MTQAAKLDSLDLSAALPLPASPRVLAQSVGSGFVPCIYTAGRIERLVRKAKTTPEAALRYGRVGRWRGPGFE